MISDSQLLGLPQQGTILLERLIPYFPWALFCRDQGFIMPYPEVMMTSDRAHALYTQISGLLMQESWEIGNELHFRTEPEGNVEQAPRPSLLLHLELSLDSVNEAWEIIGMSEEKLREYLLLAAVGMIRREGLNGVSVQCEYLGKTTCRLTAKEA